ncbi:MAG: S-layer homology domain-containing protein [Defluviitaleaceae bacterium]|nr:S-layer homology domain-containing protein [Defluviitaleaceae bacterium]MCL2836932.1 S-layer homology domain-containing protein [Defluviitaleaceae bacterium]
MAYKKGFICIVMFLTLALFNTNVMADETGDIHEDEQASPFFLDSEGHWAEDLLERWAGYGVIGGDMGYYRPDDNITLAEFAAIVNNLMKYPEADLSGAEQFTDLDADAWYFETMLKLAAAGVIIPRDGGRLGPEDILTREACAVMLAKAFRLPVSQTTTATAFVDNSEITLSSRVFVRAMNEMGFITGYPSGRGHAFRPAQPVTRAEAVSMFDPMVDGYVSEPGVFTGVVNGTLLVGSPDVALSFVTVTGNLYLPEGAAGAVLDDVTVGGEMHVFSTGEIVINNSRISRLFVDDRDAAITVELLGASQIDGMEMRVGGHVKASQNPWGYIRNIVIPANFPDGQQVVMEGEFRLLSNRKNDAAVNTRGAVFNTNVITPPSVNDVTAIRPTTDSIEVEIVSSVLGTAHVLILKDTAPRNPTDEEIRDITFYSPPREVFDFGSFRVFPGSTHTLTFTGANQTLGFNDQGHVVHVMIENERERLVRLETEPAFFHPGVTHLSVISPTNAVVNLEHPFANAAAVEEAFDLFIVTANEERQVDFRAFNVMEDSRIPSKTYRLAILYDEEIEDLDHVTLRPKNNYKEYTAQADFLHPQFVEFRPLLAVGGNVDITGSVSARSDIYYVLTDEFVPDYYLHGSMIVNSRFPTTTRNQRFGSLIGQSRPFDFYIHGFPSAEFYYLYVVIGSPVTDEYSDVLLFVLER